MGRNGENKEKGQGQSRREEGVEGEKGEGRGEREERGEADGEMLGGGRRRGWTILTQQRTPTTGRAKATGGLRNRRGQEGSGIGGF